MLLQIAGLAPNMDVANAALPLYVTMLLFFGGQLIRFADMPSYWYWFSTIDFVK
jgi:ATP-binding cassette subfamily G (WHITE) protein 2